MIDNYDGQDWTTCALLSLIPEDDVFRLEESHIKTWPYGLNVLQSSESNGEDDCTCVESEGTECDNESKSVLSDAVSERSSSSESGGLPSKYQGGPLGQKGNLHG